MSKPSADMQPALRHLNPGALRPFIEGFAEHLATLGHTRVTIKFYSRLARQFDDWICQTGVALCDVDDGTVEQFAHHQFQCPGKRQFDPVSRNYVNRVRRFVHFLVENGIVPRSAPPAAEPIDPRVAEFQEWLRDHRGISESTIGRRCRVVVRLLPALGGDPATYDAGRVRRVILDASQRNSRAYTKTMTTALRSYLRFLAARNACRAWLDQAVPSIPNWQLSALPRYLSAADVERLISSCDLTRPGGIRDRAILLLLARLGLRAGDITTMRFDDIRWKEGMVRVRGKSRQEAYLPLPQEVGDALLDYVIRGRPRVDCDRIFLRARAPHRPFRSSSSISHIVRFALAQAGITDAPSHGAHLLRHSAATSMLRAGATLDAIGTVLRHRSLDTTAHYAKIDVGMLHPIAQPWPGEVTC